MKTKINDLNVNYIKEGEGKENVLILEGWGTNIETYRVLIDSLKTYSTVYCFDMPGFGKTDEPKKSYTLEEYVDLTIKFVESQGIKELSLIGHSNGGKVIIKMMAEKDLPFKVNKIVLIGSAGIVHEKTAKQKRKIKMFKLGKKFLSLKVVKFFFPNALENLKKKSGSADYRSATPVMRETLVRLVNTDVRDCLPKIKAPTILIYGEYDTATPATDGELMSKMIPDAGFIKVNGATHYVFLEYPVYVNNIIKTFFTNK